MNVAATMPNTIGVSHCVCRWPMTSSIRNFVEYGSTKPLKRLIAISTKLSASSPRRGMIISRSSGQTSRIRSPWLFFGFLAGSSGTNPSLDAPTGERNCPFFQFLI